MDNIITVVNHDITTPEGWQRVVRGRLDLLSDRGKYEHTFTDVTLTLEQNPATGEVLERPVNCLLVGVFLGKDDDEVDQAKQDYATLIKMVGIAGRAAGSLFVTEAWISVQDREGPAVRPSLAPNREEVALVHALHRRFGESCYRAPVVNEGDQRTGLGAWEKLELSFQSRFSFVLPVAAVHDPNLSRVQAIAREWLKDRAPDFIDRVATHKPVASSS